MFLEGTMDSIIIIISKQSQDGTTDMAIINLHETYQCRMYSRELLMMGREDAQNM